MTRKKKKRYRSLPLYTCLIVNIFFKLATLAKYEKDAFSPEASVIGRGYGKHMAGQRYVG